MSTTPTDNPSAALHESIRTRWSPREFLDRPIAAEDIRTLFEAARWAPSCFNEQPWRFVVATKDRPEQFARILGVLVEKNQEWARSAYLIGFSAARKTFSHNSTPNRFGLYDTGAAAGSLAIQATTMGIRVHFMGGFDAGRARTEFGVPEDFEIGAAFAAGYIDENSVLPPTRSRKPLAEMVFAGNWGQSADFAE
ncbi:MAG TPA: nitroreductase family protein [Bryobacteraceae bacterium]|jgi:nitroreductase|nr:nitroreductase family protein [Bryobacteraceae bacterium]